MNGLAENRVIVMSAPNGARRSHADHSALPMTPQESAEDAIALVDAGVAVLHLHVRDDAGAHSLDADRYREAIREIRKTVADKLIVQVTTEAVGRYSSDEQMALVRELRPEAVSLALREICPAGDDERATAELFAWMWREKVWPQIILYSLEDIERFEDMRRRGVFSNDSPFTMFVLGKYGSAEPGSRADLDTLLEAADYEAYPWATCCFGPNENDVMLAATTVGGHVRLGFENNLQLPDGSVAAENADLIRQYVADAASLGRPPATADEIRSAFRIRH
jgi:3-keto-5-aminohexanoate cleavage enzyme